MGHRDTVFPKGEAPGGPFRIADGRAYGPGVCRHEGRSCHQRVRAGRLQAVRRRPGPARWPHHQRRGDRFAVIAADHRAHGAPGALRVQLRAGPAQRRRRDRPQGRRVPRIRSIWQSRASGGNFEKGISAIGELAHKIVAMHALTDLARGVTVNVGTIKGGQSVNTTAPHAEGQIDLRYVKPRGSRECVGGARRGSSIARPFPAPRRNSRSAANSCRSMRRPPPRSCSPLISQRPPMRD